MNELQLGFLNGYIEIVFESMQRGHGSVRIGFVHGTVRAVPVFGSDGSSVERASKCFSRVLTERHGSGFGF